MWEENSGNVFHTAWKTDWVEEWTHYCQRGVVNFLLPPCNMFPSLFHSIKMDMCIQASATQKREEHSQMGGACCSLWPISPYPIHLLLCQKTTLATLQDTWWHITSKPVAHLKIAPLKEVQRDFFVVTSPQDIINTFHLEGTGPQRFKHLRHALQSQRWNFTEAALLRALIWTGNRHSAGRIWMGGVKRSSHTLLQHLRVF